MFYSTMDVGYNGIDHFYKAPYEFLFAYIFLTLKNHLDYLKI